MNQEALIPTLNDADNDINSDNNNCDKGLCFFVFFLTTIWLAHGQLWAIIEGTASLTRC